MTIKLDKDIQCFIDKQYKIDTSIFKEIQERNQILEKTGEEVKKIRRDAPEQIIPPEETDDVIKDSINEQKYKIKLDKNQLKILDDQIKLLDALIDRIDEIIILIDKTSNSLVNQINDKIKIVKDAYDERISVGCRSNLKWEPFTTQYEKFLSLINGEQVDYNAYKVVKSDDYKETPPKYGIKFYQKPSNVDYGYTITSNFEGTIKVASKTLAIVSSGGTSNINLDDTISDDLNNPTVFQVGELPKVVGFGTTTAIGINTTIYGNISLASTIITYAGIGSTSSIKINDYVSYTGIFQPDTKVVGFGTTTITINTNAGIQTYSTLSILINKTSIGFGNNLEIGFGTYSTYPSVILNKNSLKDAYNESFYSIKDEIGSEMDFDYTKSPLDPITISIINSKNLGIGNSVKFINNGNPSKTQLWREVNGDPEPKVGNDFITYYTGDNKWPIIPGDPLLLIPDIYMEEGQILYFSPDENPNAVGSIYYTNVSPTGIATTICNDYNQAIEDAEKDLEDTKDKFIPRINKYIKWTNSLRKVRNEYETQIWAYSQSRLYMKERIKNLEEIAGEEGLGGIKLEELDDN